MADLLHTQDGALRLADALLRAAGGRAVVLRLPGPAASNDDAEQLSLATPTFNDVELSPAVFRKADSTATLLLSASAVSALVETLAYDAADVLFQTAAGVVIDGVLYRIMKTVASQTAGEPYCYSLTLKPPTI